LAQKFLLLLPCIKEEAFTPSSPRHQQVFWRRCRGGKRRLLQGEFRTHILYFVLSFALLYFYLHRFIKNQKNISSFYSCYFCWPVIVLVYHAFYQGISIFVPSDP
jgi:hypothetical protein